MPEISAKPGFSGPKTIYCAAGRGLTSVPDCLACALDRENTCGFSYGLLKGLFRNSDRSGVHVTDLLGCPLEAYWDKTDPSPEYPQDMLARSLGSAVHAYLEDSDEHISCELRLEGLGVVGTADVVYQGRVRIGDIKTVRWMYPQKLPYSSHVMQVNIYAHLLRLQGVQVSGAEIQYIDMSGPSKCRACSTNLRMLDGSIACPLCGSAPKGAHLGAYLVEVPLLDPTEVDALIRERRGNLEAALSMGVAPQPEPGYLCSYCSHLSRCTAGQEQIRK